MSQSTATDPRRAEEAERKRLNRSAAEAAAGLIPAPGPLTPVAGEADMPGDDYPAFLATFNGSRSGDVVVVLHPDVATALAAAAEELRLSDAVQPALEAAAKTLGPCVLGPVQETKVSDVNARRAYDLIALETDRTVTAWLGVMPRSADEKAPKGAPSSVPLNGIHLLRDVEMTLSVEIGRARMTVRDLLALAPGTVVELDRAAGAPADLMVNGRLIARGEVVVVDEDFGLRITELVQPGETGL